MSRKTESGTFQKVPPLDVGMDDDALPELTEQQRKFVEGILSGLSASDAYRASYNVANSQEASIWAAASRLRHNVKVAAWIRAARIAGFGSAVLTKEAHMAELDRLKEIALQAGDVKAAAACEHLRGKASGLYVERSEVTVHDPAAVLAQIAAIDPGIAQRLAERFGMASLPAPQPLTIDAEPISAD